MPKRERVGPVQIYRMLPRTNCKLCGCLTCYAFAFELVSRKKKLTECPRLLDEDLRPTLEFLQEALGRGEKVEGTDFVIDKQKCAGCGICDIVCQKASTTVFSAGRTFKRQPVPPVFQIVDGVVKVVNWSSCRRASGDTLCKVCVEKCPFGTLELVK